MVIYKHNLVNLGTTRLTLPESSRVLSVGAQKDNVVLWESHEESDSTKQFRLFDSIFTGEYFQDPDKNVYYRRFIGTVQKPDGLVIHVYERFE